MNDDPWIETYSGLHFHLFDPDLDEIEIYDIVHALSLQCRFGGHCEAFYSVAEHSVLVSMLVPKEMALAALFHDSSEAYIGDMVSPLKANIDEFRDVEDAILSKIFTKFGIPYPPDPEIKEADRAQLKTEAKYLLPSGGKTWDQSYFGEGRLKGKIPKCLQPIDAKQLFLSRFWELSDSPVVQLHNITPIIIAR